MIVTKNLIADELLVEFKVCDIKIYDYESDWFLDSGDGVPIRFRCYGEYQDCFKLLIGQKINCCVSGGVCDIELVEQDQKKIKKIEKNSLEDIVVTGLYSDDIMELNLDRSQKDKRELDICIESTYKIKIYYSVDENKYGLKRGDWVKVTLADDPMIDFNKEEVERQIEELKKTYYIDEHGKKRLRGSVCELEDGKNLSVNDILEQQEKKPKWN